MTIYARRAMSFFAILSAGEIAYFNSPNENLSNGVRVMALYGSKIVDPSRSTCSKTVQRKSEPGNFLVLRPALLKIAYSTQLIDSFPLTYGM